MRDQTPSVFLTLGKCWGFFCEEMWGIFFVGKCGGFFCGEMWGIFFVRKCGGIFFVGDFFVGKCGGFFCEEMWGIFLWGNIEVFLRGNMGTNALWEIDQYKREEFVGCIHSEFGCKGTKICIFILFVYFSVWVHRNVM